jgi:hypothetical protein
MGTTLRDIIYEIGGGIPTAGSSRPSRRAGRPAAASPTQLLDMPVDYESLGKLGSIMGSGGMIVMDETSCMVDVAKYFMEFCMTESCGKCVPCRVGTVQMHTCSARSTTGEATMRRPRAARGLCEVVQHTSLCGLGQTAPNPVLSTLKYFRDEYDRPHRRQECPAGCARCACRRGGARDEHESHDVVTLNDRRQVLSGAQDDQTILEAARDNGIAIPTLCHLGDSRTSAPAGSAWSRSRAQARLQARASPASPRAWSS